MLLFDALSPAPRALRMYLAEKDIALPLRQVDVFAGENRQPGYLALNAAGQVPALQLDDGSVLGESIAIMEYLEELHPDPALIGTTPQQRARTRMWQRRCETNITENIHNAYHYAEGLQRFQGRIPLAPGAAEGLKGVARDRLAWLDGMLDGHRYIAGPDFTIADLWLYAWLDFGDSVGQAFDRGLRNIGPWFTRIAARRSAAASLHPDGKPGGVRG